MISHSSPFGRFLVWLAVSACCIFFFGGCRGRGFFSRPFHGHFLFFGPLHVWWNPHIHPIHPSPPNITQNFPLHLHIPDTPPENMGTFKKIIQWKGKKSSEPNPPFFGFCCGVYYMGVSKNKGTSKWMVYNGKPGGTTIFGNIHIYIYMYIYFFFLQILRK